MRSGPQSQCPAAEWTGERKTLLFIDNEKGEGEGVKEEGWMDRMQE